MGPIATRQAPNDEDRALLQAILDATGLQCKWSAIEGFARYDNGAPWNPLTDDGDALRLAVKLHILIDPDGEQYAIATATDKVSGRALADEPHNGDPYAATRRAIVRAAAEIAGAKAKVVEGIDANQIQQQMVERKQYVVTRDETQYRWDFGGFHAADTYNSTMGDESKWLEVTRKRAATMLAELVSRSNQQQKP